MIDLAEIVTDLRARGVRENLFDFVVATDVARQIGCSAKMIKNLCEADGDRPALPSKRRGASQVILVQPALAYYFVDRFSRRKIPTLRPPVGWVADRPAVAVALPTDPDALLRAYITDPNIRAAYSDTEINTIAKLLNESRKERVQNLRESNVIKGDDVVKMLRSFVALFAQVIDDRAKARAGEIANRLRKFGYLSEAYSITNVVAEIEDAMRELAQQDIIALQAECDSQCQGLRLNFGDNGAEPIASST